MHNQIGTRILLFFSSGFDFAQYVRLLVSADQECVGSDDNIGHFNYEREPNVGTDQVCHPFLRWYQLSHRLDYPISSVIPSGYVNPPEEAWGNSGRQKSNE